MAYETDVKLYRRMMVSKINQAGIQKRTEQMQYLVKACYKKGLKFLCFHGEKNFTTEVLTNQSNNHFNACLH